MLNNDYILQMKELLQEEYNEYIDSLEDIPYAGLRINTNKITQERFKEIFPYALEKSPFADNGYYIQKESGLGYHALHMAGFFYLQEPSASAAVTILDVKKGKTVLDLCAAPGSKSTQILEKIGHSGLLVVNEYDQKRVNALQENILRYSPSNCIILNADTKDVAKDAEGFFDYVLCDAPCSGEGMFRKNEFAIKQWSKEYTLHCSYLQKEILENAWKCLKGGGELVYSTCTFNRYENEDLILSFLDEHPDASLVDIGVPFGRRSFPIGEYGYGLRIFPMDKGEGHFICKMKKNNDDSSSSLSMMKSQAIHPLAKAFLDEQLEEGYPYYYMHHERLYGGSNPFYHFSHCKLIQHQVYLGEVKKNRFEPSHNFFTCDYVKYKNCIKIDEELLDVYYHGDVIRMEAPKGWAALIYEGKPIGGVKSDGKQLKNHYPKHLRKNR